MESDEDPQFEVVISGISGKFPMSDSVEELMKHLLEKKNLVSEENCRWNKEKWNAVPSATGKISVVKKLDDTFFGIYSGIASSMDPLMRVLLERAYEAIIDAGINPKSLRGTNTAVYTASCVSDSESIGCDEKLTTKFWLLSHVRALLANRISYTLNLQGTSWTIDSSWVGGTQCLQQAANDIKKGRIDAALVGATNVVLFPHMSQHWVKLGKLSPDGKCRSFDENASGYGRSEGAVMLLLQRAEDAYRSYGSIIHCDTAYYAKDSLSFIKPSTASFTAFLQRFYSTCPVSPCEVAYVEADGSADKHVDAAELNAITQVFCSDSASDQRRLPIGSVKSNAGHSEGASSLVALVKVLASLDTCTIPPNINFVSLNRGVLNPEKLEVVINPLSLPDMKYIAVNSLGLGNSISHALLKENQKAKILDKTEHIPILVVASARHEQGINKIMDKLESSFDPEYFSLVNNVFKEPISGHFYRGFTVVGVAQKSTRFTIETGSVYNRPVWYIFSGMGSQWPGMGAELMQLPLFAKVVEEIDSYLSPLGIDIKEVMTSYDPNVLKNVVHSFVGIVTMQIGMVDMLKALGIEPAGMIGHSLGENCCAYADGCFDKYQTIMAAYYRGKSSQVVPLKKGLMAAVGLGYDKIIDLPKDVQIACHNSDDSCTISGPATAVEDYVEKLKCQNVFVRIVNSNNMAYHSKEVKPLAPYVLENVSKIVPVPKKRSPRWISSSIPESEWNSPLAQTSSAEYHVNNFLNTVYFAEACKHVPEESIVIEISPHGLFQGILKRCLHESCINVSLAKREASNTLNFFLNSIGKLYTSGLQPDVNALYPAVEYPVSRATPSLVDCVTWDHEKTWEISNFFNEVSAKTLEISLRYQKWRYLIGHTIDGNTVIPCPLLLMETLQVLGPFMSERPILLFENVTVEKWTSVTATDSVAVCTQVQRSSNFEILTNKEVAISGNVRYTGRKEFSGCCVDYQNPADKDEDVIYFTAEEVYEVFREHSYEFGDNFRGIKNVTFTADGYRSDVTWNKDLAAFINSLIQTKLFTDICFSVGGIVLPSFILELALDMEFLNSLELGSIITVTFSNATNIMRGDGVVLVGLRNVRKPARSKNDDVCIQNLQFVPYSNTEQMHLEKFFDVCTQLISESFLFCNSEKPCLKVLLLRDDNNNSGNVVSGQNGPRGIHREITRILNKRFEKFDVDIRRVSLEKLKCSPIYQKDTVRYLVIVDTPCSLDFVIPFLNITDLFILSLHELHGMIEHFTPVIWRKSACEEITLWKKTSQMELKEEFMSINPEDNSYWLEDLECDLYSYSADESVIIHWQAFSFTSISSVISKIVQCNFSNKLRLLITIGVCSFEIADANHTIFKQQLRKGLTVNILVNDEWGTVGYFPLNMRSVSKENFKAKLAVNRIQSVDVCYISYSEKSAGNATDDYSVDPCYINYSGIKTNGTNVIGIIDQNKAHSATGVESLFEWDVPEGWSLKDAVTVPLIYAKAYYGIVMKAKPESYQSVLVSAGYTSFGEAAIAVSLSLNLKVCTTTENLEQAQHLVEKFSKHSESLYVLVSSENTFQITIQKLTSGRGVDVVVNSVPADANIHRYLECIADFGSFIQLASSDSDAMTKIGMKLFLKSVNFYSVAKIYIECMEKEVKNELHQLVLEGIKTGVVTPIINSCEKNNVQEVCRSKLQESFAIPNHQVRNLEIGCDKNNCYLTIGKDCNTWFRTVCWLLENGAKRIIFAKVTNGEVYPFELHSKRINLLLEKYSNVSVMYLSIETLTKSFDTVMNFGRLHAVFCVGLDSDVVSKIDSVCRRFVPCLTSFICLQCDSADVCESRWLNSSASLSISAGQQVDPFKCIDGALLSDAGTTAICTPILKMYRISHETRAEGIEDQLSSFFPKLCHIKAIREEFSRLGPNCRFQKLTSKYSNFRDDLLPIFILPGVHWISLMPLVQKLNYPVYAADLPFNEPSKELYTLLLQMKCVQSTGPYTILAESFSGLVGIQLMSMLEKEERAKVRLILLEGIPQDVQQRIMKMQRLTESFRNRIFDFYDSNAEVEEELIAGIADAIEQRVSNIISCMVTNYHLNGEIVAIKSTDNSVLDTYMNFERLYGQELDLHILGVTSHEQLVAHPETASIINDNVLFKW